MRECGRKHVAGADAEIAFGSIGRYLPDLVIADEYRSAAEAILYDQHKRRVCPSVRQFSCCFAHLMRRRRGCQLFSRRISTTLTICKLDKLRAAEDDREVFCG